MNTSIIFITDPEFKVDFACFSKPQVPDKIQSVAHNSLSFISILGQSFIKASLLTFQNIPGSFRYQVFNLRNFVSLDICLAVYRVAIWALRVAFCLVATTFRLTNEEFFKTTPLISSYIDANIHGDLYDQLDLEHLKTKNFDIDISQVDSNVNINDLLKIYDEINFNDEGQIDYMANTSRQESSTIYSVSDLRQYLKTFIQHVSKRVAFLGTPPAFDTPRLLAFYDQIERAVLFSIDNSNKKIACFQKKYGNDPKKYTGEAEKKYRDLLEDRARIAIDLAIAGKHCGARYIGEAMSVYANNQGEEALQNETLQDSIYEILAKKRYQIALGEIESHLGTDTHAYNKYMSSLGQTLGLPGVKNVIEHLYGHFDRNHYLNSFFKKYNCNVIIDTIEEAFKRSQILREKLIDWIKDQAGFWNQKNSDQALELANKVLEVIKAEPSAGLMGELIEYLKIQQASIDLPKFSGDWDEYLNDFFALTSVKEWFNNKFSHLSLSEKALKKNEVRLFCKPHTSKELTEFQTKSPFELLDQLVLMSQKGILINKIRGIVRLEVDTILRGLEDHSLFVQNISYSLEQQRREDFFAAIQKSHIFIDDASDDDPKEDNQKPQCVFSPELMEWLAVSMGVFKNQVGNQNA